jgi:hypothetical protein
MAAQKPDTVKMVTLYKRILYGIQEHCRLEGCSPRLTIYFQHQHILHPGLFTNYTQCCYASAF